MALSISSRTKGAIAILEVHGNLTLGPALRSFQSRARRMLGEAGCAGLVLNLADVAALDSAGVGGLVTIHSDAARRKIGVVLVGVNARVRATLGITRVDALFTFTADERSAFRELG